MEKEAFKVLESFFFVSFRKDYRFKSSRTGAKVNLKRLLFNAVILII
jgi:hypothetical protein